MLELERILAEKDDQQQPGTLTEDFRAAIIATQKARMCAFDQEKGPVTEVDR